MKNLHLSLLISLTVVLLSCQKDNTTTNPSPTPNTNTYNINGFVQKGPYLNGTAINIAELSAELAPTGKNFTAQILDNFGTFELKNIELSSQYVGLRADGFYYNEVTDERSTAQLTLFALADLTDKISTNVNILSTLEKRRVEYLIDNGSNFNDAKRQTQAEILKIFEIVKPDIAQSENLDIAQAGENNAILLALSVILQGYLPVAELSELLANIGTDIRPDGILDSPDLGSILVNNARLLQTEEIRNNLQAKYESLGGSGTIPPFEKYIDQFLKNTLFKPTSTISYPSMGKYGLNLLDSTITSYAESDNYSLAAILEEGTTLQVKFAGYTWLFPSGQDNTGWDVSGLDQADFSRFFTANRTGELDFNVFLRHYMPDTISNVNELFIYENGATEPSWSKVFTINE